MAKRRLDELLVARGLSPTLETARANCLAGEVWSAEGQRLDKPGTLYPESLSIIVKSRRPEFKSRAGGKLGHALTIFHIDVNGLTALDIGSSTGGFTDCLIQSGAAHVFSVDVGYGLIDSSLRAHPQVSVLERTNARHLKREKLVEASPRGAKIDFLVMDVSFISIRALVPPLVDEFPEIRQWVFLFKPQFEVEPAEVGPKGLVTDEDAIQRALQQLDQLMLSLNFCKKAGPESSPLPGKKSGNVELLLYYERT